jgi:hypothetical protein
MPPASFSMTNMAWADQVFSAPPARNLKGPAKYTHAFRTPSSCDGERPVDTQGNPETAAGLLFDYLRNQSLVGRSKAQPFFTNKEEFGAEICPDFIVEVLVPSKTVFIVEVKMEAYLSEEVLVRLDENRKKFEQFGFPYLVWTDQAHLGNVMTLNLDSWRMNGANVPDVEIDIFVEWLCNVKATSIGQAVRAGYSLDVIEAAAWLGKAFFPLNEEMHYDKLLTAAPQENLLAKYFSLQVAQKSWWSRLAAQYKRGEHRE